ncbi:hypothetical protein BDK51DRAFT_42679 [Blyttiomyces helicus]|uniref:Uncharacterized protein n=1 Tax=Blyttiomyces helicus TaxID=388810 RepID=A0A4P9WHL0_9FUNG|nr:hypothetical protein BDK51DRAFT_42679 [Blyttiomyces helicus]|eukprot:RKO90026.1 hypothetical protein BDK51DRAFT_42679 [Blyttiomyces helicus]
MEPEDNGLEAVGSRRALSPGTSCGRGRGTAVDPGVGDVAGRMCPRDDGLVQRVGGASLGPVLVKKLHDIEPPDSRRGVHRPHYAALHARLVQEADNLQRAFINRGAEVEKAGHHVRRVDAACCYDGLSVNGSNTVIVEKADEWNIVGFRGVKDGLPGGDAVVPKREKNVDGVPPSASHGSNDWRSPQDPARPIPQQPLLLPEHVDVALLLTNFPSLVLAFSVPKFFIDAIPPPTRPCPLGADPTEKREGVRVEGVDRSLDRASQLAGENLLPKNGLAAQRDGEERQDRVDEFGREVGWRGVGHPSVGVSQSWAAMEGDDEGAVIRTYDDRGMTGMCSVKWFLGSNRLSRAKKLFYGVRPVVIVDEALCLAAATFILSFNWITFAIVGTAALAYLSHEQKVDRCVSKQRDNVVKHAQFLSALGNIDQMKKRFGELGKFKKQLVFECFWLLKDGGRG